MCISTRRMTAGRSYLGSFLFSNSRHLSLKFPAENSHSWQGILHKQSLLSDSFLLIGLIDHQCPMLLLYMAENSATRSSRMHLALLRTRSAMTTTQNATRMISQVCAVSRIVSISEAVVGGGQSR